MTKEKKELYEFGEFRLDACERVLWRGAEIVALSPKVFETLLLLVEHEGKIISKSEMMDRIWADTFVEEGNLTQNIYTLRRLLGQDEHGGKFIENVPRRGYRFAAPVRVLSCATAEVDTAEIVVTDVPETNTLVTYAAETNGANQIVRTDAPEFSIPLSSLPRRIVSTESDAPEEIRNLVASVKPANNTRIVFGRLDARREFDLCHKDYGRLGCLVASSG